MRTTSAKRLLLVPLSSSLKNFLPVFTARGKRYLCIQFILDDSKKEEKNARLLLSPNQDTVLRFGYNSSYTLVPKSGESNKDNHIIKGISLTFSSAKEISAPVKCAFYSDALEVYFAVSVSA